MATSFAGPMSHKSMTASEFGEDKVVASTASARWESQSTGGSVRAVAFVGQESATQLVTLEGGANRQIVAWSDASSASRDVFVSRSTAKLDGEPNAMCVLPTPTPRVAVALQSGRVAVASVDGVSVRVETTSQQMHGAGEAMAVCSLDGGVVSGGSNGGIVRWDAESGAVTEMTKWQSGVQCLASIGGGSVLVSGHHAGQIFLWDVRAKAERPVAIVPSRRQLDAITAIGVHPAQANLFAFGCESGDIGFADVRAMDVPNISTFDLFGEAVVEIAFHPSCADNLICASADGQLLHIDATGVNGYAFSSCTSSRTPVWLSPSLAASIRPWSIWPASAIGCAAFAVKDGVIVAGYDNRTLRSCHGVRFA